jgi:hypothetical protein
MVIVRIKDGLGNQMFQYAAARAASLRLSTSLELDLRFFSKLDNIHYRPFKLHHFRTQIKQAKFVTMLPFTRKVQTVRRLVTGSYSPGLFQEASMRFAPEVHELCGNVYLGGLFQCEKYFADYADVIRQDFQLKEELPENLLELKRQMSDKHSVSLHIRRGDYTTHPTNVYVLPLDYYERALEIMGRLCPDPVYYLFSDDPEWVKENLKMKNAVVVSGHDATDYQELKLMSCCSHHIIANSTFSWWGAWLNPSADKIVVAPEHWFRSDATLDASDVIPESWIRV